MPTDTSCEDADSVMAQGEMMGTPKTKEVELECWKNAGMGTVGINKFDTRGNMIQEMVPGGRKIFLSPEERRMNQEVAAHDSLDVFANGMLVPVRLLDSEEDTEKLQANVNAMSETAMKALFKSQRPAFEAKVNEISNITTLNRLLEVASEVDASIRQAEYVQRRIDALGPNVTEVTAGTQIVGGGLGTKAPESRNPRSVTGRAVSPK